MLCLSKFSLNRSNHLQDFSKITKNSFGVFKIDRDKQGDALDIEKCHKQQNLFANLTFYMLVIVLIHNGYFISFLFPVSDLFAEQTLP